MRERALELAIMARYPDGETSDDTVKRAEAYLEFLQPSAQVARTDLEDHKVFTGGTNASPGGGL